MAAVNLLDIFWGCFLGRILLVFDVSTSILGRDHNQAST